MRGKAEELNVAWRWRNHYGGHSNKQAIWELGVGGEDKDPKPSRFTKLGLGQEAVGFTLTPGQS